MVPLKAGRRRKEQPSMADNLLYYGGNLDIRRHHIPSASVDLIYHSIVWPGRHLVHKT
jgi:hypothetical protein